MADPNIQLPALPAASVINDTDLLHVRQGATDKKATVQVLKDAFDSSDVGAVPVARQVNTAAPLTGGGDLSVNLNLGVGSATEADEGVVELATNAETQAGADNTLAVTPSGLASLTATETRRGLVEKATDAEASAGTDTERYVTSKQVSDKISDEVPDASTTVKGLIEIATSSEVSSGASNLLALTPNNLRYAFQGSKTTNGYMYLPNGWIIQWMKVTTPTKAVKYNWPVVYPNAAFGAFAMLQSPNIDTERETIPYDVSTTGWRANRTSSGTYFILSIGH